MASVRLGEPPSIEPVEQRLAVQPTLEFKLDPTGSWDECLLKAVASVCRVRTVDLKGHYRNVNVEMPPAAELYACVMDAFPDAWVEDPAITEGTVALLRKHCARLSWDEPIHSVADLEGLPWNARALNIKPARVGSVRSLLGLYRYCDAQGIVMYGGGMFELGPGRGQLQYLASLFHPNGAQRPRASRIQPSDACPRASGQPARTGTARHRLSVGRHQSPSEHPRRRRRRNAYDSCSVVLVCGEAQVASTVRPKFRAPPCGP